MSTPQGKYQFIIAVSITCQICFSFHSKNNKTSQNHLSVKTSKKSWSSLLNKLSLDALLHWSTEFLLAQKNTVWQNQMEKNNNQVS